MSPTTTGGVLTMSASDWRSSRLPVWSSRK